MNNPFFDNIHYRFGFGAMRLPLKENGDVDHEQSCAMFDYFLDQGFNYFDTAHGYHNGQSETTLRDCLTSRHPRDAYILVNKLTDFYFKKEEDILPLFENQLKWCGVDYFDFYLMHAQNKEFFEKYKRCHAYEIAFDLKQQGKVKHVGISFHDKADVLEQILTEYPDIEVVQIQLNYVDFEDNSIESRKCYEVCEKHGKPVIVMEPVKGGNLVKLPDDGQRIFDDLRAAEPATACSNAGYALRFAASLPNVMMVLSGMSSMEQLQDDLKIMKDFQPLNDAEYAAIDAVCESFRSKGLIACTACRYCTAGCPKQIAIPDLFSDMNAKKVFGDWNSDWYYMVHTQNNGKANDCIQCGKCENICPQKLPIRDLLKEVSEVFDKA